MSTVAPCDGLESLARDHDLVLCDVFGTLHDAAGVFPAAVDALARFRAGGGTVVLVSNAALPGALLARALAAQGIGPETHDAIVSSADVARIMIEERAARRVHHIGADRERVLFEAIDVTLCEAEAADLVVCTGYPDAEPAPTLAAARARGLDLLCTNPDRQVRAGAALLRFAGLVAEAYAALGGRVIATGKPDPSVYALALRRAEAAAGRSFATNRVLGIGDSWTLDVSGALACGFGALHVGAAGEHRPFAAVRHPYRLPALAW